MLSILLGVGEGSELQSTFLWVAIDGLSFFEFTEEVLFLAELSHLHVSLSIVREEQVLVLCILFNPVLHFSVLKKHVLCRRF